jgi:hypothetical protein
MVEVLIQKIIARTGLTNSALVAVTTQGALYFNLVFRQSQQFAVKSNDHASAPSLEAKGSCQTPEKWI